MTTVRATLSRRVSGILRKIAPSTAVMARKLDTIACTANSGMVCRATIDSRNANPSSPRPSRYCHDFASRSRRRGSRPSAVRSLRAASAWRMEAAP